MATAFVGVEGDHNLAGMIIELMFLVRTFTFDLIFSSENALRPFVSGILCVHFFLLFSGSVSQVRHFQTFLNNYSVLETAKANGLNPEAWLNHISSVLPDRFAQNPDVAIDDLLPWTTDMFQFGFDRQLVLYISSPKLLSRQGAFSCC